MTAPDTVAKAREIVEHMQCCDFAAGFGLCIACIEKGECERVTLIAAALDEQWNSACEAMAQNCRRIADIADRQLGSAKRRYARRELLSAVGYQGDPDAECIHGEAVRDTAIDCAAAADSLKRPAPERQPDA